MSALHEHGIPTWQDVRDLSEENTEDELRRVLNDPATASAVLWVTPEVAESQIIRGTEVPKILQRIAQQDGFFIMPVVAGGLDFQDVAKAVDGRFTVEDLANWNVRKIEKDPADRSVASDVARWVLRRRISIIHKAWEIDRPLLVSFHTRCPAPSESGYALAVDWSEHFSGRQADRATWQDVLLPALHAVVEALRTYAPGRRIEVGGLASISAVTALGSMFLAPKCVPVSWSQFTSGRATQPWGLGAQDVDAGFVIRTVSRNRDASDIAVLVSVAGDVEPAFARSELPPFRAVVKVARPDSSRYDIKCPGEAVSIAYRLIEGIRKARDEYRAQGAVHLFMAVPVGLAMLVGQLLNTFGPVQLSEHEPTDSVGLYRPSVRINPGG